MSIRGNHSGENNVSLQYSKTRSKIHEYFTLDGSKENYICNICGVKFIKQKLSSTGNIRNHLQRTHKQEYDQLSSEPQDKRRKTSDSTASTEPLSKDVFQEKLMNLIVGRNLPFSIVEDSDFQDLLDYITKDKTVSVLPGRTSMTERIENAYAKKKQEIKSAILESDSKVSIVVDGWTSSNQIGFQGVICRYISKSWELVTVPLDLTEIVGSHTGENMGHLLINVLEDYGLLDKIYSITTDNASNMDTLMRYLETELLLRGISFNTFHQRVRCLAHIVNLCAQGVIDHISSYLPLQKLRNGIQAIRSSPQRRGLLFSQCPPGQKRCNLPILDCKNRWNSTLEMLQRAHSIRKELNMAYRSNSEFAEFVLTYKDWSKLIELVDFLKPLEEATQMTSVQRTPNIAETTMIYQYLFVHFDRFANEKVNVGLVSANVPNTMVLDTAEEDSCTMQNEEDENELEDSGPTHSNDLLRDAAKIAKSKLEKYYPDSGGKSTAIGMILHPSYKFKWFRLNKWPSSWINDYKKYFQDEWNTYKSVTDSEEASSSEPSNDYFGRLYKNQMRSSVGKRDIDKYLESAVVDKNEIEKIGLLKWWEARTLEYPIVSKMARDSLAASGSGVPVESFFSSGTDVLSSNRQRLSADHIKHLMCLRKWSKLPQKNIN